MVERLNTLETDVLKSIREKRDLADTARRCGVPAAALGKTIADLQLGGYLAEDGSISAKGLLAIGEPSPTEGDERVV